VEAMMVSALFPRPASPLSLGLAFGAILCMAFGSAGVAAVSSQSPWVPSANSKTRLVSGTVNIDGKPTVLSGVQLRMDQGWKTYWKNPGDSGMPPGFDWAGSKNLKSAEVLYPAPHRFADGGGTAIGYDEEVVFPVKVTPEREGEPIELKLAFDYGLCRELCIPNDVSLGLEVPASPAQSAGDALLLASSLALVPKPAEPEMLPRVSGVEPPLDGAAPRLFIDALFAPGAKETDLFIDGGDVLLPVPKPLGPPAAGKQRFVVNFVDPAAATSIKGKPLTLTLVSDLGSSETIWTAK
jgi:DsbC/DsbD-like thiol-disulfide interchange protein